MWLATAHKVKALASSDDRVVMLRQREACRLARGSFDHRLAAAFVESVSEESKRGLHERQGKIEAQQIQA